MRNRFISFSLVLCLAFSLFIMPPVSVHAMSSDGVMVAEMFSEADWVARGSEILSEVLAEYGSMALEAMDTCAIVVGSAGLAWAMEKGITWTANTARDTALTLGRDMIYNVSSYDETMQRYIASVISNVNGDVNYYDGRAIQASTSIMNWFDTYLGSKIDSDMLINAGLISTAVISAETWATMTDSMYNTYSNYYSSTKGITYESQLGTTLYSVYYPLPSSVKYAFLNTINNQLTFYDADLEQVVNTVGQYMQHDTFNNRWSIVNNTSYYVNAWNKVIAYDLCGVLFLQGVSIANALGLDKTYTLPWDTTAYDEDADNKPLVFVPQLALDIADGVSDKTIDDVIDSTVDDVIDTPIDDTASITDTEVRGFWGTLWDFLSKIIQAILSIPANFLDVIKDALRWLFVPDNAFTDEWITNEMSYIDEQTGVLTYPLAVTFKFLNRTMSVDAGDMVLTIPDVSWMGHNIIKETSFNMTKFLNDNATLKNFMGYYYVIIKAVLIIAVVNLARKKLAEMEAN